MKKNYFKKSLSLIMTVLMLMSCWVFVPGEHNHASAAADVGPATTYATYHVELTAKFANIGDSGHIIIYYYPVNADGTLNTSVRGEYILVNSAAKYSSTTWTFNTADDTTRRLSTDTDAETGPIQGWPCGVKLKSAGGSASLTLTGLKIGDKSVITNSGSWGAGSGNTKEVLYNNTGSGWDGYLDWPVPSWSTSSTMSGTSVDVPSCGSRTTSWSTQASWKDQYGVTWSQSSVLYTLSADGVSLIQDSGKITGVTVSSAAISNITSGSTKNVTVTASGAGKTQTAYITLNAPKKDVTFENMFSLSDWYYSESSKYSDSNFTTNLSNGTLKIYKPYGYSENTTASSYPNSHNANMYSMPVTGGQEYTVEYTSSASTNGTPHSEVFLFWYDTNDNYLSLSNKSFTSNGKHSVTFTAPDTATKCEIRFDNNGDDYSTETFSNIAVYPADRAAEIELETWGNRPYTKAYTYKAALGTSFAVPTRAGYAFNGWYLDSDNDGAMDAGEEVTDATGTVVSNLQSFGVDNHYNLYADWVKKTLDIGYDNLFSLSDWAYSASTTVAGGGAAGGVIEYDLDEGYIKVTTGSGGEAFSSSNLGAGQYLIPVTEGETYVLDYDATYQGNIQTFVFYYNATGTVTDTATGNYYSNSYSADAITFTVPAGVTQVGFRFGTYGDAGNWAQYKNIGLYKKAVYDAYAKNYSKVREPFKVGDTTGLMYPSRVGYAFDGWEKADGTAITSVEGLRASETVYATWTKQWTVTFLNGDGSVLGTASVRDGEAAAAPQATPTKAADANGAYTFSSWDKTFSNVTEDMTVTPQFTTVPHTITYDFVSGRTCTTNAIVDKRCSGCGYYFFQSQPYDGTTETAWIALGHNFEGQAAVTNTSDGETGTHEVRCKYYYSESCGGTTRVAHNFDSVVSTEGATCTHNGIVTEKCACGQTRKVEGTTAPDVHNYDYETGTPNGDKATHTVACTYNSAHTKSVNCTDDDKDCICDICGQELVHSYVNKTKDNVVSEAECEIDAVYYLTCQCGKHSDATWTDTGSALEHTYTNYVYNNDAKCEIDGTKTASCDHGCGTTDTIEAEGTALEHDYTGEIKNNGDGTHSYLCKNNCGNYGGTVDCSIWKENATANKCECVDCGYTKGHDWGKWTKNSDNTALAAGKMTRTCNDCGATDTIECTYEITAHSDETCTTPETTTYTCTECGHGYSEIGEAATGHDFSGEYKYDSSADTHQQLCANGCGAYGVGTTANAKEPCTWTYTNKESGKHTAACVCGNSEEQNCSGGTATCTAQAECQYCGEAYGTTTDHSFKGTVKVLEGDVHAYLCEYCNTDSIYGVGTTQNMTEACSGGDATCSALAVCNECKDTYGALDTDDHKWGKAAADADNAGEHIYTCEYNNEHKKSEACVSGSSKVVAPTCTDKGYTIQTCKECSYEWNTDYTDATEHNWVDPVCNGDGTHTLTCNNKNVDGWVCDETLTLNCAESAITFGYEPATCTEQGYTKYQCTVCNYTWDADFVPATGHSYTNKLRSLDEAYKRSEKTCTEAETYWYRCDNCTVSAGTEADKYADDLASIYWSNGSAVGHDMQKLVDETDLTKNRKSEATCTATAVYYYSCSVCGAQDTTQTFTYKSALGHDYQDIVDEDDLTKNRVSEATCTSAAVYYKSCSRCGAVSNDTFEYGEKTGHSMTKTEAKAETCTEPGNVEYYTCSNCNKKFSDEDGTDTITKTEIASLGHDWVNVAFKAATCEEDGHSAYKQCTRCDANTGKVTEGYGATGHDFSGTYYIDTVRNYHAKYCVNDNCLADGEKAYGIGDEKYSVEYDGLDYVIKGGDACDFDSFTTATDENGLHSHNLECVCGNAQSVVIDAADIKTEVVAPTCTDAGYTLHTCQKDGCGDTWKTDIVEKLGHDLTGNATSNGNGTHSVKCVRNCGYSADAEKCSTQTPSTTCGEKNKCDICGGEFGEEIDHVFTNYVYNNDATCTADGTKTAECDNCDTNATDTVTATGTKLGHDMSAHGYVVPDTHKAKLEADGVVIAEPTCGEEGRSISYCSRCDHYVTKVVPKNKDAHDMPEVWTKVGGNCASGVTYVRACTICGKKESKTESVPHNWKAIVIEEAGCTVNGYINFECSVCGFTATLDDTVEGWPSFNGVDYSDKNIVATGEHAWQTEAPADEDYMMIDGVVVFVEEYPTYNTTGRGYKKCTICNAVEKVTIAAYGNAPEDHKHPELGINDNSTLKYVAEVKPTCTVGGHEGYYECTRCSYSQYVLDHDAYYIPALGHADKNADGKCDTCKTTLEEDSASKNCGCICHKDSGFMKFIYKILRFFWKLFGINETCACGVAHY